MGTDLLCKPTGTHQWLQGSSCHPWHIKNAIPYGQTLGLRFICLDGEKFRTRLDSLVEWLVNRGYNEKFVAHTSFLDRKVLIKQENRCNENSREQLPLVVSEMKNLVIRLQTMLDASFPNSNNAFDLFLCYGTTNLYETVYIHLHYVYICAHLFSLFLFSSPQPSLLIIFTFSLIIINK